MRFASLVTCLSLFYACYASEYNEFATSAMHEWIVTKSATELDAIYSFLQAGADPNAPNPLDSNHVPLITVASPVFYPELAIALINNGAVVDKNVIEWVLSSAKVDILLYYLRQIPLDIVMANQDEYLCVAIKRYGKYSVINWREENNWDSQAIKPLLDEFHIDLQEKHLILAVQESCPHEMISKFIKLGLKVSHSIMQACLSHNLSVLQILIDAGGDPNYQCVASGVTPLLNACIFGMPETAICLLSLGANPCKLTLVDRLMALEYVPGVTKDIVLSHRIILGMIRNELTWEAVPETSRPRIPEWLMQLVMVLPSAYAFVSGGLLDEGSKPADLPIEILQFILHLLMDNLPRFVLCI